MFQLWAMLMLFRRRHARAAVAMMSAFSIAVAALGAPSESATASVGSDRTQIAQLEQQIAAQGAHVESLVSRYDEVQGHIGALDVQIDHDHALLAADQRAEAAATIEVRGVAIQAYMTGVGMGSPTVAIFSDASSITKAFEQNNYLAAANTKLNDDLNSLQRDQDRTRTTQSALRSEQAQAKATLRQLTNSKSAATSAIASDEAMLSRVSGNLRSLLAAANKRRQAAQLAAERALATAAPSPQAQPSSPQRFSPPPPPSPSPSPGGYANPLRAVIALSSERIDQGVDYSGFGPIYAVGNGVVLSTVNAGWPGGTFIAYRLTDGPANGLVVYAAEDIEPTVQIGATVTSSTVLGQMYAGPTGIETGWADPSASGDTMARTAQQFDGSNSTAFGYNFSQFLQSVGAPGGVLQNSPPTGFLPGPWPHW